MSMICREVVPRTMESSTSSTLFPWNSAPIALSFCRTERSRSCCPGMMNVRPTYRFLMNPSRYSTPSRAERGRAAVRLVSGMGITTSIPWSGASRRIFSARRSPMRSRAR